MERCAGSAAADVPAIRSPPADLCPIVKLLDFLYKIVWSSPFRCLLYDPLNPDDNDPSTPRAEAAAGAVSDGQHSAVAFVAAALGVEASETEGSENAADGDQASVDVAAAALAAESSPAGNAVAAEFDQIRGVAFDDIPLGDVDDAPSEDDDVVDVGLIEEYSSFELIWELDDALLDSVLVVIWWTQYLFRQMRLINFFVYFLIKI